MCPVCEEFAVSHEMVFNHKKSVILIFRRSLAILSDCSILFPEMTSSETAANDVYLSPR